MKHAELGVFLKSRRARVRPVDAGLPGGSRRRVPGLRRDEVARLADMSVDYYIELEQGRGQSPSEQILSVLAQALRLDNDERAHLFHLAGRQAPLGGDSGKVHQALRKLLERLDDTPAMVITDLHETLFQNPLAIALLGDHTVVPGIEGSLVYRWFTEPAARAIYPAEDHPYHSAVMVADLRAAAASRGNDRRTTEMVAALRAASTEFADLWDAGEVAVRHQDSKRVVHPVLGIIAVDCHSFYTADSRQRLLWLVPQRGDVVIKQLQRLATGRGPGVTGTPFNGRAAALGGR
jgi:transcriptional regulator with XRE-family HTH domain